MSSIKKNSLNILVNIVLRCFFVKAKQFREIETY